MLKKKHSKVNNGEKCWRTRFSEIIFIFVLSCILRHVICIVYCNLYCIIWVHAQKEKILYKIKIVL
jgi:hypothetical protein